MENKKTRDANSEEIELARKLLKKSILALRAMIANLTDKDIDDMGLSSDDGLKEARKQAQSNKCSVPIAL